MDKDLILETFENHTRKLERVSPTITITLLMIKIMGSVNLFLVNIGHNVNLVYF